MEASKLVTLEIKDFESRCLWLLYLYLYHFFAFSAHRIFVRNEMQSLTVEEEFCELIEYELIEL